MAEAGNKDMSKTGGTVLIIGAGTMGAGIAQVAAAGGWHAFLCDVDESRVSEAVAGVVKRFDRLVEKGRLTSEERDAACSRLRAGKDEDGADADLAIEAVVESIDVKVAVFRSLLERVPARCILASNTSSLSIGDMAAALSDSPDGSNAGRLVGMHFFNPVPLMPLVEVISTPQAKADRVTRAAEIAASWGKTVVHCLDTPGFIVNRVARGYYLEAMRMLGEGVAGIEEIDAVMTGAAKFRMGPFALMDLVGIDVNYTVSCSVYEQKGETARLKPHEIQAALFNKKELGRKTGRGFYDYGTEPAVAAVHVEREPWSCPDGLHKAVDSFFEGACETVLDEPRDRYIVCRILAAIFNEAGLALDDGVATADDIDTAMKLGTNYPRGPIEWSSSVGHERVRALLCGLDDSVEDGRFRPAKHWIC